MRARGRWVTVGISLLTLTLFGSALAATAGHESAQAKKPIVIGWAFDSTGAMAPFDGPALAAAKLRVAQLNAKGGVSGGREVQIPTRDTPGNKPATAKARAPSLLGKKADIPVTTWDADPPPPAP